MGIPLIERVKIQAQVLVPLVETLHAESNWLNLTNTPDLLLVSTSVQLVLRRMSFPNPIRVAAQC